MSKKIKNKLNLDLKELVVLAVVVSFVTSALVGFVAGGLSYQLLKEASSLPQTEKGLANSQSGDRDNAGQTPQSVVRQEEAVVEVVKKIAPAVVSIIVTKDVPVIEKFYQEGSPFGDDFLRKFFGDDFFSPFQFRVPQYRQKGTEKREIGGGTGFIVSSNGLILTNRHVVADTEADYTVLTNEGEKIPAKVLARDPIEDLAILKIDRTNLPVVPLGDSDQIEIGQTVIAIGNALGEFRNTVSVGVVSGLKRSVVASSSLGQSELLSEVIQTDAAINPGNSGGPLLNLRGKAIGVNVAVAQGAENIGFSLPINKAKRDIEQVQKQGKISYPFLGVRYVLINQQIKQANDLPVDYGAWIIRGEKENEPAIIAGSPADRVGLQDGDIILEINGERIDQNNSLGKLILKYQVGEIVSLKILRDNKEKIIKVKLGERS